MGRARDDPHRAEGEGVGFADWLAIDAVERERGAEGKPREKFTRIEEILRTLDGGG